MTEITGHGKQAPRADQIRHVQAFVDLWNQLANPPVLEEFVARFPDVSAADLSDLARIDQRRRWDANDFVPAEDYLERFPAIGNSAAAVVALLFGEFQLLEERGERPTASEFASRFPDHGAALSAQIQLHLLPAESLPVKTKAEPPRGAPANGQTTAADSNLEKVVRQDFAKESSRLRTIVLIAVTIAVVSGLIFTAWRMFPGLGANKNRALNPPLRPR